MLRNTIVFALTLLVLAASAAAQTTSDVLIIPATAYANGLNGTRWVTDLTLFNFHDDELSVGLQFQEAEYLVDACRCHGYQTHHRSGSR